MKKLVIALVLLAIVVPVFAVAGDVRIAQVYAGGGSSSATAAYKKDYVVLFNNGTADLNISGWVLEYGSATGTWGSSTSNYFVLPEGTWIGQCQYLMVACAAAGTGGADFAVTPDFTTTNMSMSATAGKVGLFSALNASVACGSEIAGTLQDKVAWATATCAEGAAVTGTISVATGFDRNGLGAVDTNNNAADFTIVTSPVPMYSGTPAWACSPVATENQTFGALKATFR